MPRFREGDKVEISLANGITASGEYVCSVLDARYVEDGAIVRVNIRGRENAINVPVSALTLVAPQFEIGDAVESRLGNGRFIITAFEEKTHRWIVESIHNEYGGRKRYAYKPNELMHR